MKFTEHSKSASLFIKYTCTNSGVDTVLLSKFDIHRRENPFTASLIRSVKPGVEVESSHSGDDHLAVVWKECPQELVNFNNHCQYTYDSKLKFTQAEVDLAGDKAQTIKAVAIHKRHIVDLELDATFEGVLLEIQLFPQETEWIFYLDENGRPEWTVEQKGPKDEEFSPAPKDMYDTYKGELYIEKLAAKPGVQYRITAKLGSQNSKPYFIQLPVEEVGKWEIEIWQDEAMVDLE